MIDPILRKAVRITPIFAMLLVVFTIVMSTQLAGSGSVVRALDREIDSLRQENEVLGQKVASASSLLTITAKAKEVGFAEATAAQTITLGPETLRVALGYPQ